MPRCVCGKNVFHDLSSALSGNRHHRHRCIVRKHPPVRLRAAPGRHAHPAGCTTRPVSRDQNLDGRKATSLCRIAGRRAYFSRPLRAAGRERRSRQSDRGPARSAHRAIRMAAGRLDRSDRSERLSTRPRIDSPIGSRAHVHRLQTESQRFRDRTIGFARRDRVELYHAA